MPQRIQLSRRKRDGRGLPLRCSVGLHDWYSDSALIRFAYRCNRCGAAQDPDAAAELLAERERMAALPGNPSIGELYRAALGLENR